MGVSHDPTNLTVFEDTPFMVTLPQGLNITDPNDPVYPDLFSIERWTTIGNISYSGGVLRYTPPLHYFSATPCQPITFVMKACDNNSVDVPKCQTATIYICVLFPNHPPQFSPAMMYVLEDQTTFMSLNISAALSDVEDGTPPPLNGTHILTDPAHGKAYYNNITGNVTYRPDPAYYGLDLIYVPACDTLNGCHCEDAWGHSH